MYKLIALDMDGTLLRDDKTVSPAVFDAIQAAKAKGAKVVLATGRPIKGVDKYLTHLNLKEAGDYVATFNGALVQDTFTGDVISHITMNHDDLITIYEASRELRTHVHFFDKNTLYTPNKDISKFTVHEAFMNDVSLNYINIEDVNKDIVISKVMMIDYPEILDRVVTELPKELVEKYTIVRSAPFFLEFLNIDANKGNGIMLLANKLGIKQEEVICVGDAGNDIHMVEYAGLGVAMGNATDDLKAVANYITKSNNEDGVAHVINEFILK
ncbi:sugar-phosphatase [Clostridium cellulovorans]|uniref:Cof-like hydrolase n=1 Tax=Clostridium cellulovorans (strain ATCC 35296 / DSM 3052 / OCM 3 / 743B) TaxID=573061 RepID=D9SRR8_CLOC7|nr:sugar-phosphatase [Clostridium cellulovorans]ADL50435.1 Cof-like hydrolase [Clostridium cellulovorans 743B]